MRGPVPHGELRDGQANWPGVRSLRLPQAASALVQGATVLGLPAATAVGLMLAAAAGRLHGQDTWKTDFSRHTVPLEEIVAGGPPKDGIPAIDEPKLVAVAEADRWLDDGEPVAMVRLEGEARAYPLQILIWHEIVNDEVGGIPVSVTFCPLCNTTLAFDRRFDGRVLDFGTTGRLRHSDLVMYDRQTETWWQQATGEGIVGEYAGRRLEFLAAPVVSWWEFKQAEPDGLVLSRDTGHRRRYGQNPYVGYDSKRAPMPGFFNAELDGKLPAMERVVALEVAGEAIAVPFSALARRPVIEVDLGGRPMVVFWSPGTASALDADQIAQGRDVGATGVFAPTLGGRRLHFRPAGDGRFTDRETGSTWTISGRAVAGPLAGRQLEPVAHGNHFWFAWSVFQPGTEIVTQ